MFYLESGSMPFFNNPIFGILAIVPIDADFSMLVVFGKDKGMDVGGKIHWYK